LFFDVGNIQRNAKKISSERFQINMWFVVTVIKNVCTPIKAKIHPGRFIMFSVITNIYNRKTKGRILMEFFTATGKPKKFFLQQDMFNVCTTGDILNISSCQKKNLFQFSCGCEKFR